ncbi:DUF1801 domain-containing protein [Panacibacter sp. DH6]|uniref:DUF1801 domain-containing protein n=1 Tax=Panacibacter microcysteis TaxID=2793269 RepID=A0A931E6D9_9BACT|nr:DUF1801 domain-containing protein [Panacibacter microcysteis]MBG9375893.1 DUF1801 domain-containing protein [Panacibacter microcysteis]
MPAKPANIDEYINSFPAVTKAYLQQVRSLIRKLVPQAAETISYGMAAYNLHDTYLIYFAGFKNHISMYPFPSGNPVFDKAFADYKTSGKGTVQFPLNKPLPADLVTKLVLYRVEAVAKKNTAKKAAGKI